MAAPDGCCRANNLKRRCSHDNKDAHRSCVLTAGLSAVCDIEVGAVVRRFINEEDPGCRQHGHRDCRRPCRESNDIADAPFMESAVNIRSSFDKVSPLASDDNLVIGLSRIRTCQWPCDRLFVQRLAQESRKINNRRGPKRKVELLSRSRQERRGAGSKVVDVRP